MLEYFKRDQDLKIVRFEGDDEPRTESEELLRDRRYHRPRPSTTSKAWIYLTLTNLLLCGTTLILFLRAPYSLFPQNNAVLRPISWWSPILDQIEIPRYSTQLNGTLFSKPNVSMAREEPGPANDAKWVEFEDILTHVVSREEILKLGKDPDTVARFDNKYWGLGENAYMVQLDVMHQIHCLNMLRKAAFADYPGYTPRMDAHDKIWWIHLGHCTDILLQNIQCNANTEVLTLDWMEDYPRPFPDFSVNRKCRDFNAIVDWHYQNMVDKEKYNNMPVPQDQHIWPAPWLNDRESELGHKLGQHHQQEGDPLDTSVPVPHHHGH
ncbi:hypothetical protein P168DRAFT_236385 [Aspergillus campestris IBT 28561]|uniref:Tat pathway signal sequence n=1 Tax=Aspergillus campestris (strain IBT 28561) TaxID=1392248 RepID=A0A2I1D3C4_ASPC2|nr:uncharacterized protein P168DRAFT_236385 [Aspergillus campestris IBT 28561]PKY04377.1 hypothetical protein P168DRAFT_236385 [Aspergillus campestris IBT 28561]